MSEHKETKIHYKDTTKIKNAALEINNIVSRHDKTLDNIKITEKANEILKVLEVEQ
ncbi:hypothetical protein ACFLS8_00790 [Chloroflexota bacterium]